jgi:hypothetical protein
MSEQTSDGFKIVGVGVVVVGVGEVVVGLAGALVDGVEVALGNAGKVGGVGAGGLDGGGQFGSPGADGAEGGVLADDLGEAGQAVPGGGGGEELEESVLAAGQVELAVVGEVVGDNAEVDGLVVGGELGDGAGDELVGGVAEICGVEAADLVDAVGAGDGQGSASNDQRHARSG